MAYTALSTSVPWPLPDKPFPLTGGTTMVLDATGEKAAMIGYLHINGRPGTTKTIDTTGSSSIGWQGGATAVFDNGSSTLDIGIQGVTTGGPTAVPDGTYTVKATATTGADATPTLTTTNSWHQITPTTGTATLTEGDLIAVVLDFTNRAGSDAINVATNIVSTTIMPVCNAYVSSAWGGAGVGSSPQCVITFNDGTIGTIDGTLWYGTATALIWNDSSNPDEYGMIFRVPFACKVDALWASVRTVDGTSDFTLTLSSSAESTRNTLASVAVDAAKIGPAAAEARFSARLATEVALEANTDYCISIKATGAGNVRFNYMTLGNAAHRVFFPGGTTMRGVTANNGSDFGSSSTTTVYPLGVRISQIDTGSAGGLLMPNLRGNFA